MAVKEKEGAEKYINPYNFVSLDTTHGCSKQNMQEIEKENKDLISDEQNLTGYIECTLDTKTPIILPDIKSVTEEKLSNGDEHPHFNFFNYNEKIENTDIIKPVIPGSEIRGMLRSDFEILTNSCMSSVNMDKKFIARTTEKKNNPGLIKKDGKIWKLYTADRIRIKTTRKQNFANGHPDVYYKDINNEICLEGKKLKTGDKVYLSYEEKVVRTIWRNGKKIDITVLNLKSMSLEKNDECKEVGYLFIGEDGNTKKHDSIFKLSSEGEVKDLIDFNKSVEALKGIFDVYNDKAINKDMKKRKKEKWYPGYDLESDDYIPVWYEIVEKRAYLSLASIGKEAYFRDLNSLLNVANDVEKSYTPCIDKSNICKACQLFGYVSSKETSSSKIRVSDANYEGTEDPYLPPRTLQELSTPRTSNPMFYSLYLTNSDLILQNEDENFTDWNYDYKYGSTKKLLKEEEINARGRKVYWHHIPNQSTDIERTNRNCTAQPVKEKCSFKFKVYFEKISEENLKNLIATLTLKYNSDKKCSNNIDEYYDLCHKIGRGKPLGYGSVKIKVDNVIIKELTIDTNNKKVEYNLVNKINDYNNITINDCPIVYSPESFEDILKIYNFNYIKENYSNSIVDYPIGVKDEEKFGYLWFVLNRSLSLNAPHVYMVLPKISEGGDIIEGEEKLKGSIKQNANIVLNIDGLNMPILQEIDDHNNNRGNNNNRNNNRGNNNNHNYNYGQNNRNNRH